MAKVVVVGSVNMDLVARSPRLALAGETLLGHSFRTIAGGKGANQAVAARRMGAEVTIVGRVGADEFGATMRQNLRNEGINTDYLTTTESESSGVALITVDDRGENTIIVVPGANGRLSPYDIEAAHPVIADADILLMQLEIPIDVVEHAARAARESNVLVMLNAAPARSLPRDILSLVDYLVVNESEVVLVAESGPASPQDAAVALSAMGPRNVVATLGEEGSLLVRAGGEVVSVPAFLVKAVDTTAAGDGFLGAFAVALASGMAAPEALRLSSAAGALAVTREGAQPSLPTYNEVEAFLRARCTPGQDC